LILPFKQKVDDFEKKNKKSFAVCKSTFGLLGKNKKRFLKSTIKDQPKSMLMFIQLDWLLLDTDHQL